MGRLRSLLALVAAVAVACCALTPALAIKDELPASLQPLQGNVLTFLTVGDWGKHNSAEEEIAEMMAKYAAKYNSQFILALGDNFYEDGVSSVDDEQFETTFERVFSAQPLQVPWYVVLGNHDYHGNPHAQILYQSRSKRWNLPDYYYSKIFTIDPSTTLEIVFIDTVRLEKGDPQQLDWIRSVLSNSTASFVLVAGHYPVFSGGEHGNTDELVRDLRPMLEEFQVTAYLSGHDHNMQHLSSNGIDYFLSGGGAKKGTYSKIKQSKYGKVVNGFMMHQLNSKEMRVTIVTADGDVLYTSSCASRKSVA